MANVSVILGFGDVGKRLATCLIESGPEPITVIGTNRTVSMQDKVQVKQLDLDGDATNLEYCRASELYYLIPPQLSGERDQRSEFLLSVFRSNSIRPNKVVLLSTSGVYGDCSGEWVDERSPTQPGTDRAKRRLNSEQQWLRWSNESDVPVVVMRVPGIYARSRIPVKRLEQGRPVVRAAECGYTNRIHADDLAVALMAAMRLGLNQDIYNATDGHPGKLSEYLQAAAKEVGLPPLPEISMCNAEQNLSKGMMSYVKESRRISNEKMMAQLKVELRYPNFVQGLKFG